jgi:phospholipase A2
MDETSIKATKRRGFQGGLSRLWQDVIKPAFPEAIQDIKILFGMTALKARIRKDIMDPSIFPEVEKVAEVRRGLELCADELAFLKMRKAHVRTKFAEYMGVDPEDVHPDDVPIIAYGGSGGGFRAMIACLAYGEAMRKSGLWNCLIYIAGVSGSCWSIAAYYTIGKTNMQAVIDHCKSRFSKYHPLSGEAIRAILSVPGGTRVHLGPLIQKSKSGLSTVAMDLYSIFTTGWIFFQDDPASHPGGKARKEVAGYQRTWHKFSSARDYIDGGEAPLPIMTAIRHERPWKYWEGQDHAFTQPESGTQNNHPEARDAWYQWFEITPYEVGCDEIEAWVPTWGFGRPFSEGKSTMQLPEQSLALLLGLATSAPAAPLASYLSTISRNLPTGFIGKIIHSIAHKITKFWGKDGTNEFQSHHPLHACHEHNFMYHYTHVEKGDERPPGLENSPRIQLIDSGMDNNCPTYVLLHPKREVDVIINMDASSDVQLDSFQERVDQIGSRRGIQFTKRASRTSRDSKDPDRFRDMYVQVYDGVPCARPEEVVDSYGSTVQNPPAPLFTKECKMLYMPLLPNEKAVPGFDPSTAKFSGSYNLVWTEEQVQTLVKVCEANFEQGHDTIKRVLFEVWQKKKAMRESGETMANA